MVDLGKLVQMSTTSSSGRLRPRWRRVALVIAAVVMAVLLGYIAFLYLSYIDRTVTAGSAFGFTIGQSKEEAFTTAERLFTAGKLNAITTLTDYEEELRLNPWLEQPMSVEAARNRFFAWDYWRLVYSAPGSADELPVLLFEGDYLTGVGPPGHLQSQWQPPDVSKVRLRPGQTRQEVLESLEVLSNASGYEDLRLSTGWMARRQPLTFSENEFLLVEGYDRWTLLVGREQSFFNTIELQFRDGRLSQIHRHRQFFELP